MCLRSLNRIATTHNDELMAYPLAIESELLACHLIHLILLWQEFPTR